MALRKIFFFSAAFIILLGIACQQSAPGQPTPFQPGDPLPFATPGVVPATGVYIPVVSSDPSHPILTPTPDDPHILPTPRTEEEEYVVQSGDTLGRIARAFNVSLEAIIAANELANPDLLSVGQRLIIPAPEPTAPGPGFKIIPDSELVYGPASAGWDVEGFIVQQGGYLSQYYEEVDDLGGETFSGALIVARVAAQYSLNPRLLLAVLEYQSGWVTQKLPAEDKLVFPMGATDDWRKGLYRQLAYAANNLNRGYYTWKVNGVGQWNLTDGSMVPINPTINAATAGVQYFFSLQNDYAGWQQAVSEQGLFAVYQSFFGYPFSYALEPLLPRGLLQPPLQLPFEEDVEWAFTGGPHGGWGDGSAWAALDFAPHAEALGCVLSDAWVVAAADGLVIRSEYGEVVQDLDTNGLQSSDGLEQTGWTLLYMHIDSNGRVDVGTYLRAGERIGHPSCEGGVSSGTHLHLARRYNGEWIPADQQLPFVLDGWVSRGAYYEYDGYLEKNGVTIEAWAGLSDENKISR